MPILQLPPDVIPAWMVRGIGEQLSRALMSGKLTPRALQAHADAWAMGGCTCNVTCPQCHPDMGNFDDCDCVHQAELDYGNCQHEESEWMEREEISSIQTDLDEYLLANKVGVPNRERLEAIRESLDAL